MQQPKVLLKKLQSLVKNKLTIDEEIINYLNVIFLDKSEKVIEVLKRGLRRYVYKPSNRVAWMAVGEDNEHLIYPQLYCSCQDFYKNVVIKRERPFCKHILAQVIAEELNTFEQIEVPDEEFKYMIKDLEVKFPHS